MPLLPDEQTFHLLSSEKLTFDIRENDVSPPVSDERINEKYVRGEIRIITEQARYPLSTIAEIVESDSYELSPEYQRRHRWTREQQSRLIESLIMNVPIPPIFLYEYDYSRYEVMDGLQRLTAIHDFYRDKYALSGLTQWRELNDRLYSQLPERVRGGIDRRYLSSVILLKETAKNEREALNLKQMVFERINSGGERLSPQETRNAIYDGPMNRTCIELSKTPSLCRLWGIPAPNEVEICGGASAQKRLDNQEFRRMKDVELVLRFFAYRQKKDLHKGVSLSAYFDAYLQHSNRYPCDLLFELADIFERTVSLIEEVFNERAFWLYRSHKRASEERWGWYERPTTAVYDPLMYVASNHLEHREKLCEAAEKIRNSMEQFYKNNYATFGGRDVNQSTLEAREKCFNDLVSRFI